MNTHTTTVGKWTKYRRTPSYLRVKYVVDPAHNASNSKSITYSLIKESGVDNSLGNTTYSRRHYERGTPG